MAAEGPIRLPGPYEILELNDGQKIDLKPVRWEIGTMSIKARWTGAPAEKEILVLRLHMQPKDKPVGIPYWDLTAQTLIAQLRPLLETRLYETKIIRITAHGEAPRKRFTVETI